MPCAVGTLGGAEPAASVVTVRADLGSIGAGYVTGPGIAAGQTRCMPLSQETRTCPTRGLGLRTEYRQESL
jgi:hypothetical protein